MKNKNIAILENRSGKALADLVRKYGGTPISAPALSEVPDIDLAAVEGMIKEWVESQPDYFIFQTGVGVKALFKTLDELQLSDTFLSILDKSQVIVRGPKPTAILKSRKVRIDLLAGEPYTTAVIFSLIENIDLQNKKVVVQRYGDTNFTLQEGLIEKGAIISEVATYRWQLPADQQPLLDLIEALSQQTVDMVCFTSASQVDNLFTIARKTPFADQLHTMLNQTAVASIGPVCTAALEKYAVNISIEASPPKLGPFIQAINTYYS